MPASLDKLSQVFFYCFSKFVTVFYFNVFLKRAVKNFKNITTALRDKIKKIIKSVRIVDFMTRLIAI